MNPLVFEVAAVLVVMVALWISFLHPRPMLQIPPPPPLQEGECIPRVVYYYWDGNEPLLVRECVRRLTELNPGWQVVRLDSSSPFPKPRRFRKLVPAHKADVARIEVLSATGGVWVDATCVHLAPLCAWVDLCLPKVQGFYSHRHEDLMENWAFATPSAFPPMCAWRDEFRKALHMTFRRYNAEHPWVEEDNRGLPYLTQHQTNYVTMAYHQESFSMRPSCGPGGPFYLWYDICGWEKHAMRSLLRSDDTRLRAVCSEVPFVKITRSVREQLTYKDMSRLFTAVKARDCCVPSCT